MLSGEPDDLVRNASYDRQYRDFASLLLLENLGPRTLQSLALVAEVIHGVPTRFTDPARFSFAHGGKDGHPFPVPLKTYDESLSVLRRSLDAARIGDTEKADGFRRLNQFVRALGGSDKDMRPGAVKSADLNTLKSEAAAAPR